MAIEGLEFYATKELIDELIGRWTFQGAVVYATQECTNPQWEDREFSIRSNSNLSKDELIMVMEQMIHILRTSDPEIDDDGEDAVC